MTAPPPSTIWRKALAPGTATLTYTFTGTGVASNINCSSYLPLTSRRFGMVPDMDRDGKIGAADAALLSQRPFRIWLNDDFDWDPVGNDISGIPGYYGGSSVNSGYPHVCGLCDLIDFFPIWLDAAEILSAEPTATLRIRHPESRVNVVLTSLTAETAGDYLTVDSADGYGPALDQPAHEATKLFPLWQQDYNIDIPPAFLSMMRADPAKGIILVEGAGGTSSAPLILEALTNGVVFMTAELPMRIHPVEQFYRWLNVRPNASIPNRLLAPLGRPDDETNGKHVFFTHGFRVPENEARAWGAKMFKKLYQSGMDAKFTMVTWKGDEAIIHPELNYYQNAVNAFEAALPLAAEVNGLVGDSGSDVIFMAHSLGNMLVSSAIQDYGMRVTKYFTLNAAIPAEAFDTSTVLIGPSPMRHEDWLGYGSHAWAANWHKLFENPVAVPMMDGPRMTMRLRTKTVQARGSTSGCTAN